MFNQKGSIENFVPAIIFLFVAVLGIFFFTTKDSVTKEKQSTDIQRQLDYIYAHQTLLNYLIQVDESGKSKSEIIAQYYYDRNYVEFEKDIKNYFGSKLGHFSKWQLDINTKNDEIIYTVQESVSTASSGKFLAASAIVPLASSKDQYLKINLYLGRGKISSVAQRWV